MSFGFALATTHAQPVPILQDGGSTATGIGTDSKNSISLADCAKSGNCSIEHILLLANSIIKWAVAVSGSIALLMYVIGGVWMIFSRGNSGQIERGKDIIIGTSVSLIFILGGWLIIQFALQSLGAKPEYQLTQTSCAGQKDCPNGQICDEKKKRCVELCQQKADAEPDKGWQCQQYANCGLPTLDACNGAPNCATRLCLSKPADVVCCYTP